MAYRGYGIQSRKRVSVENGASVAKKLFGSVRVCAENDCLYGTTFPDIPASYLDTVDEDRCIQSQHGLVPIGSERCKLGPRKADSGDKATHIEFLHYDDQVLNAVPVVFNVIDVSCGMNLATHESCKVGRALCSDCEYRGLCRFGVFRA